MNKSATIGQISNCFYFRSSSKARSCRLLFEDTERKKNFFLIKYLIV
ncbi:hypothetical protein QR98_0089300, partial [Sarcoptes scabiei]